MASLFWVGGTNTWNSTASTKWATSSGGAGGAAAPTAADDVFFDANSGAAVCTLSINSVCRSLNCTGFTGTLTHPLSTAITIGDGTAGASNVALLLVAGMTYSLGNGTSSSISFVSTSTTAQTVTTGGKVTGNLTFNGVGGSWQLADTFNCPVVTLTLTAGTLNTNGQTATATSVTTAGAGTKVLTLGASAISATWNMAATTGLTLSAASSTITHTGSNSGTFVGGGLTYGAVILSNAISTTVSGANTFASLSRTATAIKTCDLTLAADQVVSGTLTIAGNSAINRLLVTSDTLGTTRTITAATVTASYVDLRDITGAGASGWSLAAITGLSGDAGGNSGITFTASTTQTSTGTASFTWSTHSWTSHVPLPQDDVAIPNAFIATRVITADMPRLGRSITCTCTGSPQFNLSAAASIFGSLTLATGMTSATASVLTFAGRSSYTITTAGVSLAQPLTFAAPGGTYQLQDALTATTAIALNNGTLDTNGKAVSCTTFANNSGSATRALTMGTTTWSLTATGAVWTCTSTGMTLTATSSTILLTTASATARTFAGGALSYGTLSYVAATSTGGLTISGNNTFVNLNVSDATSSRILTLTGTTQTITGSLNGVHGGATGGQIGVTGGTISKASGVVNCDYLSLTSSTASGGATFYAGVNSTNVSGNSGWTFAAAAPLINLQYDFTTVDLVKFVDNGGGAWVASETIVSGALQLACTSGYLANVKSTSLWDFTNSSVMIQVVNMPNVGNGSTEAYFRVQLDGNNYALILVNNGNWNTTLNNAGVSTGTSGAYNSTSQKWLRIRNSSTSVLFEGSPDGVTWTTFDTRTVWTGIAAVQVVLLTGYFGTEPSPGNFTVDNLNIVPASVLTKTQGAISHIASSVSKTQSSVALIVAALTKTQPAVSRIATKPTRTQSAISRVALNVTKTKTAIARITSVVAKTQTAVARVATLSTKTQTAIARVATKPTKTQTATANIATGGTRTITQAAVSRIAIGRAKPQPATSRIASSFTKPQTAISRIATAANKAQTATARTAITRTKTQASISRVAIGRALPQTATARLIASFANSKTQAATAHLISTVIQTKTQTATARIVISSINRCTQTATANIKQTVWVFQSPILDELPRLLHKPGRDYRFWRRVPHGHSARSILKQVDGSYLVLETPSQDQIAVATIVYMGGHIYQVSAAEAASLTAAGYTVEVHQ